MSVPQPAPGRIAVHVRKTVVFDYTLVGENETGMDDPLEVVEVLRHELGDPIGRAVDAYLNPLDDESFIVRECVLTVLGDAMDPEDEMAVNKVAAAHLGTSGVQVHRRFS